MGVMDMEINLAMGVEKMGQTMPTTDLPNLLIE